MSYNEVIITQDNHPDIYEWLSKNIFGYEGVYIKQQNFTLTSDNKINAYCDVSLRNYTNQIKYPFGYVEGNFNCDGCKNLTSLIGAPEKVDGYFSCENCKSLTSLIGFPKIINSGIYFHNNNNNNFSNNPSKKERYKIYLAMWLEFLESVNNEERKEYIKSYKNKTDVYNEKTIIPVEILKEYGF